MFSLIKTKKLTLFFYIFFLVSNAYCLDSNKVFYNSLSEKKYSELTILRSDDISINEKKILFQYLIDIFNDSDWSSWPLSKDTEAKEFIEDVSVFNHKLFKTLQTAGYLFSKLKYNPLGTIQNDFDDLVAKTPSLFDVGRNPALSPIDFIDSEILSDDAFIDIHDGLRYEILSKSIRNGLFKSDALFDIAELFSERNSVNVYREIIKHIVSSDSSSRILSIKKLSPDNQLFDIADKHKGIRQILSKLFTLISLDNIAAGQHDSAKKSLLISSNLGADKEIQSLIDGFFDSNPTNAENSKTALSLKGDQKHSSKNFFSNIFSNLFFLILVILVVFVFISISKRKKLKSSKNKISYDKAYGESIQFDDLDSSEIGIKANL